MLPPVTLTPDPALRGRARRRAVGVMLQAVMEEAAFRTAPLDRTLFTALLDAAGRYGAKTPIMEDIARQPMRYRRLLLGAAVLGRRLDALAPGRRRSA